MLLKNKLGLELAEFENAITFNKTASHLLQKHLTKVIKVTD